MPTSIDHLICTTMTKGGIQLGSLPSYAVCCVLGCAIHYSEFKFLSLMGCGRIELLNVSWHAVFRTSYYYYYSTECKLSCHHRTSPRINRKNFSSTLLAARSRYQYRFRIGWEKKKNNCWICKRNAREDRMPCVLHVNTARSESRLGYILCAQRFVFPRGLKSNVVICLWHCVS